MHHEYINYVNDGYYYKDEYITLFRQKLGSGVLF